MATASSPADLPPREPGQVARTFQSMRVRNFRLFVFGQLVSTTGTWMQATAGPLLVLQLTRSGTAVGIDAALTFLPILLFGAWGGLFADRFDNRKVLIATGIAYAVPAAILWALVVAGVAKVWMVYSLSFVTGIITAVDMPTRQSFYLEMVGPADLTNAMSLNTATFTGTRIVGPVIAALIIKAFGMGPVFLINAITYAAVVAALLVMRPAELRPRARIPRRPGQVREGVRHVLETPALRLPMLVMAVIFLFSFNFMILMPLLSIRTFGGGAGTYGNVLALFGLGSLAGALLMASRTSRANVRLLSWMGAGLGAASVAVAVAPWLPLALALMPVLGATAIGFAITANSTLQLNSDDSIRGRVMALYSVVFLGSTPIGGPIAGWVGEHLGPRAGLLGGGIIAVVAGLMGVAAARNAIAGVPARASAEPAPTLGPRG